MRRHSRVGGNPAPILTARNLRAPLFRHSREGGNLLEESSFPRKAGIHPARKPPVREKRDPRIAELPQASGLPLAQPFVI